MLGTDKRVANFFNTAETLAGSWHLVGMEEPGLSRWVEVTTPQILRKRGQRGGKISGGRSFQKPRE